MHIDKDVIPDYPLSWQARALTSLMRTTVKPAGALLMRHPLALNAGRLGLALPMPKHVSVVPAGFSACGGEWVR
ncbi:MAG: alpha/beta hydrolase, partial [Nonomuraea sp.]|nr:alpha/beta hydrolase [Nonomuraea sp.]